MPLRSAQGTIVTRGYPVGNEVPPGSEHDRSFEPHQRPLYFAHGNIDGLDFWGEEAFAKYFNDHGKQAYGHMVLEKIDEARGGDSGVIKAEFSLQGPSGRVIGDETQAFTFRGDDHTRIIDCEFTVRATHGPLTFGDSKEGTFGIRVVKELDSPPAHMVNSQGAEGEKAIWGKRADWVNYDGKVDGEDVGIAVLDHPKSFRHPTTWHARGYGLFAANPFGLRDFTRDPESGRKLDHPGTQVADVPLPRNHPSRRLQDSQHRRSVPEVRRRTVRGGTGILPCACGGRAA